MHMLQWISLFYSLLGCYHLAIAKQSDLALRIPSLEARQTSTVPSVPSQCESVCDPVNTVLESGCTPSQCYCTTSFESGIYDCFVCVGTATNTTDYTQEQQELDTIVQLCAANGVTLPELTFPGSSSSTSSSSTRQQTVITSLTATLSSPVTTPSSQIMVTSLATSIPSPSSSQTSGAKAGLRGVAGALLSGIVTFVAFLVMA
ncbi:uncharacterized protein LACBIDRAFT_294917 [Laccaria bicolor S238N-H82]|uniref:Predicted protein n=1 Tax=Laccaria bicolor (strain S238N-H82 / ATCC MYA-4686) TaxID=486041 RepID=B0DK53_LACBS|nr:uncharacterized protein LACBIDRAFT_294917 [Laccaria bicolor S238N-H82]EDR05008.1 predicted protein [Laccaria bicolor S238N-H82]|eukprot:XP_001884398.1 predicted protein [Laccaria bicolor S238N-H82]